MEEAEGKTTCYLYLPHPLPTCLTSFLPCLSYLLLWRCYQITGSRLPRTGTHLPPPVHLARCTACLFAAPGLNSRACVPATVLVNLPARSLKRCHLRFVRTFPNTT